MNFMDFYFNEKLVEQVITGVWVIIGIILLVIYSYTKNNILRVIGIGCLVTSISTFIFMNVYALYSSNFYFKLPFLAVMGFLIYFSVKKFIKLDKADSDGAANHQE